MRHGVRPESVASIPSHLFANRLLWAFGGERLAGVWQHAINRHFARAAAKLIPTCDLVDVVSGVASSSISEAHARGIPVVLQRLSSHMLEQCRLLSEEYRSLGLHWTATPQNAVGQELEEYATADVIVVPSEFVRRSFLEHGTQATNVRVVNFGVSANAFAPVAGDKCEFKVIYAGALSVRKGIKYLVDGFKSAKLPLAKLVLLGGASREASLFIGLKDPRILTPGHRPQEELPRWYQEGSVFVMPSIEEGLAMVQVQALACGLPLICTTNTGGEDLLQRSGEPPVNIGLGVMEYPAGYVIPIRNADAIAFCLERLYGDSILQKRKRAAALRLRATALDWGEYAIALMRVYNDVKYPR